LHSRCPLALAAGRVSWRNVTVGPVLPGYATRAGRAAAQRFPALCSCCTSGRTAAAFLRRVVITSTPRRRGRSVGATSADQTIVCPHHRWAGSRAGDSDGPNAAGVQPDVAPGALLSAERIVVLSGDHLDALCALGCSLRIVSRPSCRRGLQSEASYLALSCTYCRAWAPAQAPTSPRSGGSTPDLILCSQALTPKLYSAFGGESAGRCFTGNGCEPGRTDLRGWARPPRGADGRGRLDRQLSSSPRGPRRLAAAHDGAHYQRRFCSSPRTPSAVRGRQFPRPAFLNPGRGRRSPCVARFTTSPQSSLGSTELTVATPGFAAAALLTSCTCLSTRRPPKPRGHTPSTAPLAQLSSNRDIGAVWLNTRYGRPARAWWPRGVTTTCLRQRPDQLTGCDV